MLKRLSCTRDTVLFHILPFLFLRKNSLDRAKFVLDRLLNSQLKTQCMVKSLRKKRLIEGTWMLFESTVEVSLINRYNHMTYNMALLAAKVF